MPDDGTLSSVSPTHNNTRVPDTENFRPAWWLPGAHAQTIVGRGLRSRARWPFSSRHRLELEDGDFVDLDIATPSRVLGPGAQHPPWVLVLHGLEGSGTSGYMRVTCTALVELGVEAIALNFRGCSGEANRLLRSYHSGQTEDVAAALRWLNQERPGAPYGLIGFSLGGNVALKFLGEIGNLSGDLRAAAAVSVPYDLEASAAALEQGLSRLYTWYFLRTMIPKAVSRASRFPGVLDAERIGRCRTLREFDDTVTAPVHGFADADDYYRRCSSSAFLEAIRVPTLLVQALDDPFVPVDCLPGEDTWRNPSLRRLFTPAGGHLGFVTGFPGVDPRFWAENAAVEFVGHRLLEADPEPDESE